jgi:hypothetical protein
VSVVPGLSGRWWPEPVDEELLRVAVGPAPGVADAWKRARRTFVLDDATGPQLELVPQLWRRLTDSGVEDPDLPRMRGIHRRTWYVNQQHLAEVARVAATLDAEGIPMLVLKGAALARLYYGDVGLRPMGDIDVMVPPAQRDRALSLLIESGWRRRDTLADSLDLGHGYALEHPSRPMIDLHWRVGWEFCLRDDADRSAEPFWAGAVPLPLGPRARVPARTLCAADHVLHFCAHGTRASGAAILRSLADAATVISAGPLDWDRLVVQAQRYHLSRIVYEVLTYLEQTTEVGVPCATRAALAACPLGLRDRLVFGARADPRRWEHIVGGPSTLLSAYLDLTAGLPATATLRLLPEWLRVTGGFDHTWQVPIGAVRYCAHFARRRLAGDRPGDVHLPPARP